MKTATKEDKKRREEKEQDQKDMGEQDVRGTEGECKEPIGRRRRGKEEEDDREYEGQIRE